MVRIKVLKKDKEFIILRKANKNHVCHECSQTIPKGVSYIEDHINYLQKSKFDVIWKKHYVNRICLLCWKGEVI